MGTNSRKNYVNESETHVNIFDISIKNKMIMQIFCFEISGNGNGKYFLFSFIQTYNRFFTVSQIIQIPNRQCSMKDK